MLAARLSQPGAGRPVSFSQRYEVKWLQFLVRRLYEVPMNCWEAWKSQSACHGMHLVHRVCASHGGLPAAHFVDDGIELLLGSEREAVEHCLSECPARRLLARLGEVDAADAALVMASVCILPVANDHAGMQEGATDRP